MKDASPAILSSLSVVDGIAVPGFTRYLVLQYQALDGIWYCGTRLYKVFGIAAPGFTRYLVLQYNTRFHKVFCNAVPGCTRYLVLQYQALQAIWYCGTKALQVCWYCVTKFYKLFCIVLPTKFYKVSIWYCGTYQVLQGIWYCGNMLFNVLIERFQALQDILYLHSYTFLYLIFSCKYYFVLYFLVFFCVNCICWDKSCRQEVVIVSHFHYLTPSKVGRIQNRKEMA